MLRDLPVAWRNKKNILKVNRKKGKRKETGKEKKLTYRLIVTFIPVQVYILLTSNCFFIKARKKNRNTY